MFRNRLYLAVVSGHFAVDTLNSLGAVLLAVLAVPLGLSNAQIGFALTLYLLSNSLSQPFFGWLSDRMSSQATLLASIGLTWLALFFFVIALVPGWSILLICFALAPLGSGLFHPIGTASAAAAMPRQVNSATAVFFLCGQMGLAIGPILGGLLFRSAGSLGVLPLAALALIPAGMLFIVRKIPFPLADEQHKTPRESASGHSAGHFSIATWVSLSMLAFISLVAVRSSIQTTFQSFLPKLFADRGWDPAMYGLLAGTFMATAAIGNVIMGQIADRYGKRVATVLPLLLSIPAGLLCLLGSWTPLIFLGAALAGLLVGGQHSILVVHAQQLLPTGQRFAAGLILGFTFASGAIGAWLIGLAADVYGLTLVLQITTWCALPAALLALTLPGHQATVATVAVDTYEPIGTNQLGDITETVVG